PDSEDVSTVEGPKYCAAPSNDVTGRCGENVYDERYRSGERLDADEVRSRIIETLLEATYLFLLQDIPGDKSTQDFGLWRRDRQQVARLICMQMLRCGHIESAKALAEEMSVQDMVDLEVFTKIEYVVNALLNKDSGPCLEWIAEHRSKLRRMNSKLEQIVRVQVDSGFLYILKKKQKRRTLPAYYYGLLSRARSEHRWQSLADLFREELPRQSAFAICLQCGLSAYKTPHCSPGGVEKCPTCQPCAYALAEGLPYAHTVNSRLICSFSGEALNEENHPMMMPDGRVYGEKAIRELQVSMRE
ncbi:unnamed protein product, partial [Heligmosomoides polygyrus]